MPRRRSLRKDNGDMNKFRWSRDKFVGHSISTEWYQTVPFFFTRDRCPLWLTGQYRGRSAFLICNGPSLVSGKYDLSLLKYPGVMTYGMNNGPRTVRPNFWSCVDDPVRFIKSIWLDPQIMKIVPHAHAEKKIFDNESWTDMKNQDGQPLLVGDCPNVIYFHRNEKFMPDRFLFEDTVNWGDHSDVGPPGMKGGRTVMLPCFKILFLLGFRRIYLLGADFTMTENYAYHFDEQRQKGAVNCNNNTYDKMRQIYFPQLKPYFDAEGFQVYNCNPDSAIDTFPYVSYEEAISDCTKDLGDITNERTWGMYSKPEEKAKWQNEAADDEKPHLQTIGGYNVPVHAGMAVVATDAPQENKTQSVQIPPSASLAPQASSQTPQIISAVPEELPDGTKIVRISSDNLSPVDDEPQEGAQELKREELAPVEVAKDLNSKLMAELSILGLKQPGLSPQLTTSPPLPVKDGIDKQIQQSAVSRRVSAARPVNAALPIANSRPVSQIPVPQKSTPSQKPKQDFNGVVRPRPCGLDKTSTQKGLP